MVGELVFVFGEHLNFDDNPVVLAGVHHHIGVLEPLKQLLELLGHRLLPAGFGQVLHGRGCSRDL